MNEIPKFKYLYPYEPGTFIADGFPGHCIIADRCQFRLHHHIMSESGKRFGVSTVGLMPDSSGVKSNGTWYEFGWEGELFETMVFNERVKDDGHLEMALSDFDLGMVRSLDSIKATEEHWKLVHKYLKR